MKNIVVIAIAAFASTLPFGSARAEDRPSDQGLSLALRVNARGVSASVLPDPQAWSRAA